MVYLSGILPIFTTSKDPNSLSIPKDSFIDFSHYFKSNGFVAGFTTRSFPFSNPEDRIRLSEELSLDPSNLLIPTQVHGNRVYNCSEENDVDCADALVSNDKKIVLSIQVADCIPLYLLDNNKNICALVHSGWRGTAKKIVTNTIWEMERIGSHVHDITALIGPSIQQCCFEIGPEVAVKFPTRYLTKGKNDRSFLDLSGVIQSELEQLGLKKNQINLQSKCTCCHPELFHSYRRNGKLAGRMIALCGWV
ncbi:MAG: peptidoglycan editing factor PgeF [Fidelibacterota bacterium]